MDSKLISVDEIKTRTAGSTDAENIAQLVNAAFRPERFFIDADRPIQTKCGSFSKKANFYFSS
jgi:hypothetical protein